MLHEFRLINGRSENNETISFFHGAKSFRSHWNVGAVYIAPKITIAGNMENEKSMGSGTTSEYLKSLSSGLSPLPPDRVNDCAIFEVVGIDLAGLLFLKTGEKELIPLTPAMFLIENRCSDTTDIDELNSRDLRKRMKYRIKLLSDLRQRFRKEYLSELIQKQNDNRVREPRIGEMVLIGNDNKKRLSWPIAKIIELIPGRDGEIRTVQLKTQHGTVIRPVQRIFPLEVQAIANSDKELKEESISVKSTKPEKVLNTNDAIVNKYTSSGRLVKEPKRLDLLNYNCYRFETLPKSQRGGVCCE
ncbi:integrase catalytic domain-containing protein [Trichonephila clavipes]|nr:integrase catalytic domain-containing protein [Trichonephila clavipes]